jgi:hypothetical protein
MGPFTNISHIGIELCNSLSRVHLGKFNWIFDSFRFQDEGQGRLKGINYLIVCKAKMQGICACNEEKPKRATLEIPYIKLS